MLKSHEARSLNENPRVVLSRASVLHPNTADPEVRLIGDVEQTSPPLRDLDPFPVNDGLLAREGRDRDGCAWSAGYADYDPLPIGASADVHGLTRGQGPCCVADRPPGSFQGPRAFVIAVRRNEVRGFNQATVLRSGVLACIGVGHGVCISMSIGGRIAVWLDGGVGVLRDRPPFRATQRGQQGNKERYCGAQKPGVLHRESSGGVECCCGSHQTAARPPWGPLSRCKDAHRPVCRGVVAQRAAPPARSSDGSPPPCRRDC